VENLLPSLKTKSKILRQRKRAFFEKENFFTLRHPRGFHSFGKDAHLKERGTAANRHSPYSTLTGRLMLKEPVLAGDEMPAAFRSSSG